VTFTNNGRVVFSPDDGPGHPIELKSGAIYRLGSDLSVTADRIRLGDRSLSPRSSCWPLKGRITKASTL
jgi:hypothetical protein